MSAYYSKFQLNTYRGTPYFESQVPSDYPLNLVLQKCKAFRRLPPNLQAVSGLAKGWAIQNWADQQRPAGMVGIEDYYDGDGYELDPDTRRRLTDVEVDAGWGPNYIVDAFTTYDVLVPEGGFADPMTWEEPSSPTVYDGEPPITTEQLRSDVASRGVEATAAAYGMSEADLLSVLTANSSPQFVANSRAVLGSPYFRGREGERQDLARALALADEYDDLGGAALATFDRATAAIP